MSAVLIDSNVLLDLMTQDERWNSWSAETMERTADHARLVIYASEPSAKSVSVSPA